MPPAFAYGLYLAALAAQGAIRRPHDRRRRALAVAVDRKDALDVSLILLLFPGLVLLPLAAAFGAFAWADVPRPLAVQLAGAALFVAALVVFHAAHRDLGRLWSPTLELRPGHTLVTEGIYRAVRHPMYASQWLWVLGQALLLPNLFAGLGGLVCFAPLYFVRVPREEAMMRAQFGRAWEDYAARAGRVLPRLSF